LALSESSEPAIPLGPAEFVAEDSESLELALLQKRWRSVLGRPKPKSLSRQLMIRILTWREQIARFGDIDAATQATLTAALRNDAKTDGSVASEGASSPRPGSVLIREHGGVMHRVMVLDQGYAWNGRAYPSLSAVAGAITGTKWNGPRFFGLDRKTRSRTRGCQANASAVAALPIQGAPMAVASKKARGTTRASEDGHDGGGIARAEGRRP
jgi:hypothetical protein